MYFFKRVIAVENNNKINKNRTSKKEGQSKRVNIVFDGLHVNLWREEEGDIIFRVPIGWYAVQERRGR